LKKAERSFFLMNLEFGKTDFGSAVVAAFKHKTTPRREKKAQVGELNINRRSGRKTSHSLVFGRPGKKQLTACGGCRRIRVMILQWRVM